MSRFSLKAPGRFCVVSSHDQWSSTEEMSWDGAVFRYKGRLLGPGQRFQILRGGSREAAVYPSVRNATPGVAHVLKGPDKNGHGFNWLYQLKDSEPGIIEIALNCPKGVLLGLSWFRNGEALPDKMQDLEAPASDREGQQKLFQKNFGQWQLRGEIGRGKQRGAVFQAEGRGCQAAVKFPVSVREIQHLAALQGVPGVPELLDYGNGPGGGPFHVTPVLGDSLDGLLRCREDSGLEGRMSWPAAQALGRSVLATLQDIHARGVVHCDVSALNVLVGPRCRPILIDFGQSRALGTANFERAEGTVEYNSIRAGFPGPRTPVDDVESLGWLLWRCVVGGLPWRDLPREIDWCDRRARQGVYERVSRMKESLLEQGFDALGAPWAYCPEELREYLQRARQDASRGFLEVGAALYKELAALLGGPGGGEEHWADVATSKPRAFYAAARAGLLWRPPAAAGLAGAEALRLARGTQIVGTGRTELCDGGLWAELDPIWAPGLPQALCERGGWVLVADWAEQLLARVPVKGEYFRQAAGAELAGEAREGTGVEEEEDDDEAEEEERWLRAAAAEAAHARAKEPAAA